MRIRGKNGKVHGNWSHSWIFTVTQKRNIATAQKREVDEKIMEIVQLFLYNKTN
jgi:serine protease inhibitor